MDAVNIDKNYLQNEYKPNKKKGCFFKTVIGIIIVFAGLFILGIFLHKEESDTNIYLNEKINQIYVSGNRKATDKIALISINGIILSGNGKWEEIADADSISAQIYSAQLDANIKAIILEINSPGGEVSAADKIYNYIQNFRKTSRPVIVFFNSMAASGGYYVSAQTDWIVSGRLSITGSIGVIINSIKYYDLLGKIGVQDEVFKTGEFKDLLNPARPTSVPEKEILKSMINESYNVFVSIVSQGRISKNKKLTVDYIKKSEIGDGRIFSGQEALQLGLVDQIGYYTDALDKAVSLAKLDKNNLQVVRYEEELTFSQLLSRLVKSNLKINLEIPGIKRESAIQSGNFYYLYKGF